MKSRYICSAILALFSSAVLALPVSSFTFNANAEFLNPVWDGPAGGLAGDGNSMSWGQPSGNGGQSQLIIHNEAAGAVVNVGGPPFDLFRITHVNQPIISGSGSLDSAQIKITVDMIAPGVFQKVELFDINFKETANGDGSAAGCVANTGGPIASANCPDILVITGNIDDKYFNFLGVDYVVSFYDNFANFDLDGLYGAGTCAAAGAAPNCFGWISDENAANSGPLSLSIAAFENRIPEPSPLALLGASLFGIGWMRRKQ